MPSSMVAPPPPKHVPFSSLNEQRGLVSLDAARQDSTIVYRSFEMMHPSPRPRRRPQPLKRQQRQKVPFKTAHRLIPLSVAQRRESIKYRKEGFEMEEHRRHILAIRSEP